MARRRSFRERASVRLVASLLAVAGALCWTGVAGATGGHYLFDGGTPAEQQQVRAALSASSFDWSLVPGPVTIHIGGFTLQEAGPGEIFLDARLLDSGPFAWGVVQHEYAHQVDFSLLDDAARARLGAALGTGTWCYAGPLELRHDQYGCERFASTLAWSYWQSPENCMNPAALGGESGAISPAAFRALLVSVIGPAAQPTAPGKRYATRVVSPEARARPARGALGRA
jgi:hypothetical protein